MYETVVTMTSIIGLVLFGRGLRRFSKMRENEKKIFNSELEKRR